MLGSGLDGIIAGDSIYDEDLLIRTTRKTDTSSHLFFIEASIWLRLRNPRFLIKLEIAAAKAGVSRKIAVLAGLQQLTINIVDL